MAATSGGGIFNEQADVTLVNASFLGNQANLGGGIYHANEDLLLTNVTLSGNQANTGGGIYNDWSNNLQVTNSILWNNQDNTGTGTISVTIHNNNSASTLTHSLVQGSGGGASWIGGSYVDGGNNIDKDPLFATPISPTTTGDLRLLPGSPAIDSGLNSAITATTDLDGKSRIQDGDADGTATVDMGAYEAPTHYRLTVAKAGNGAGQVSGQPTGIACGLTCTLVVEQYSAITLTAAADSGSTFTEWSGAGCSGAGDCVVTMDAATQVTATFDLLTHTLTISTTGSGTGSVGLDPVGGVYDYGTVVTLTAAPGAGSEFTGWSGVCSGATNPITLTMDGNQAVTAAFDLLPVVPTYTLTIAVDGTGSGTVEPGEGPHVYELDTVVTLTATAGIDSEFVEWSGGVIGTSSPVSITMTGDMTVTATFDPAIPILALSLRDMVS